MIYILTGAIRSGKTTALQQWANSRNDVRGILTPDINGQRVFLNLASGEQFNMEAGADEEVVCVGRFFFSKKNFEKAGALILRAAQEKGWLVIDEVGPLELRGEGFAGILKQVFGFRKEKIILVVRAGLAAEAEKYFGLEGAIFINRSQLPSISG